MKRFACPRCSQVLFFENTRCLQCDLELAYNPASREMVDLETRQPCRNYREEQVCNWSVPDGEELCLACRLNRTIPDLGVEGNRQRWARLEVAKRRLVYTLLSLELSTDGMEFDLLVPVQGRPVLTGHANGLITINATEADDATREKARIDMHEPYRTLVGHFRHESAHFYWDRLIRDDPDRLQRYRDVFGDERQDYAAALQERYEHGPPPDWQEQGFISAYASVHPWEDWAETWAHYLHIYDTLETAQSFGLAVEQGPVGLNRRSHEQMLADWHQLTFALNSINRSMGISDLYPFVLSPQVQSKLGFIHEMLQSLPVRKSAGDCPASREGVQ